MKIVLLRHGNRDLGMSSDGGLNQIGKALATSLRERLEPNGDLPIPTHLFASPKKRAQETLQPLSKSLEMPLLTEKSLDERQNSETSTEFRSRVRNFLELLPKKFKSEDVVFLCTHADWLEDTLLAEEGYACGEFRVFEFKNGTWENVK